jgi:hypothetical protein
MSRVPRGFHRLEMLPTPKKHELTVKVAGLVSVLAVRDGPAKGQSTLHRRDRREYFSLGDYVHMRLEVKFGLELYTHRGSGCDNF